MTSPSRRGRIVPPNLDDRTWQDLVDEMRALIPKYAPQWTDHNPGDLGMTLIELFAWLGEGVIYRLNQTPVKNHLAVLNLLGVTRNPPAPAHTHLTFTSGAGRVVVPAGTQAQSAAREGRPPVVFETDQDVAVLPTTWKAALLIGPYATGAAASQYDELAATLIGPPTGRYLLRVPPGQTVQLCLGFDRRVADEFAIGHRFAHPAAGQVSVQWTHSKDTVEPMAWPAIANVVDGTDALHRDGTVRVTPPDSWAAQRASGPPALKPWTSVTPRDPATAPADPLFWLGARITNPGAATVAVEVDRLLFNAAPARTALTIRTPELLGQSTGEPFQVFQLQKTPLYQGPGGDGLVIQVGTGSPPAWQDWTRAATLPHGPGRVYLADPVTGEIRFGDDEHGSIPPSGGQIRALSYRHVDAGAAGNVGPGQVSVLGTTRAGALPAGITGVTNAGPGLDGADEETVDETVRRAPAEFRARDRAVTAEDFELLATEAGDNVAICRCLSPRSKGDDPWTYAGIVRAPGSVTVIIVPDQGMSVARPEPAQEQLREVRAYLEPRREVTAHLEVHGPRYLPVAVNVELVVWQEAIDAGADQNQVRAEMLAAIGRFLHPTAGGPGGAGWQIGQPVLTSDLLRAIAPSEDLGYLSVLQVRPDIPAYHFPPLNPDGTAANYDQDNERPFRLSPFGASVRVADYELVCAAADSAHTIKVTVQAA
ncbi:putative baseplate assembly protein [Amycolatopsis xylanica]|uniref:Putative baseplate assembly protein n=1 Tax=Amycolatopsis xylanica TaxID=589385 RepID=A0A1H2U8Q0_9PSEU|nr:putative baseplate assembly protein [Amycolatopsis xylanica]SDW52593.1 putative baseplate assembly protein [Amycolatopsis xylanica]